MLIAGKKITENYTEEFKKSSLLTIPPSHLGEPKLTAEAHQTRHFSVHI